MFAVDDSASLTIDELTWLSASTLIENHYALSEPPSPDRGSRALFNAVFGDSQSDLSIDSDADDESPPLSCRSSPPISSTSARRIETLSGSASPTPGTAGSDSPASSSTHASAENGYGSLAISPFQLGRQPITPPSTPPRHHLHPKYLPHGIYSSGGPTPPSPSPSVSSSTLSSSTSRANQTEWIYRRPKPANGPQHTSGGSARNSALLSRHRSASGTISASTSCSSRQVSRSPSICSSSYRAASPCDNNSTSCATFTRSPRLPSGKHRQQRQRSTTAAKPRPSSPILISSTSQLVDTPEEHYYTPPGLEGAASRSPSVRSGITPGGHYIGGGLVKSANASVSSLQLQSSIRVSPLKSRQGSNVRVGPPPTSNSLTSLHANSGSGCGAIGASVAAPPQLPQAALVTTPKGIERSLSSASTTVKSTGKPIWSTFRAKSGSVGGGSSNASASTTEKDRILLKSIPSQSQISVEPSVTPTFVATPPSALLPIFNSPRTPGRIRHTLSGTSAASPPPLPQKDKDRPLQRRDKFAPAPPIPAPAIVGVGARTPGPCCPSTSSALLTRASITGAKHLSTSSAYHGGGGPSSPFGYTLTADLALSSTTSTSPGGASHSGASVKMPSSPRSSRMNSGRKRRNSSASISGNMNDAGRDRSSSLRSQISIATATTADTATTTESTSSSASLIHSHPATPITPSLGSTATIPSPKFIAPGEFDFRSSSMNSPLTSIGSTPPYQPHHLRGLGSSGPGKNSSVFLDCQQALPYRHPHQRRCSTNSSVSFSGSSGGDDVAVATSSAARSQAYAQLIGTAVATGAQASRHRGGSSSTSPQRPRPSTSPGSGSGSDTSSIHLHPYGRHLGHSLGVGLGPGSGPICGAEYDNAVIGNGSVSTLMPLSLPSNSSSKTSIVIARALSSSHHESSFAARSPRAPHAPGHDLVSLPKAKSILTRTSSMSTKNSACGGTVKSVKFVEIPEVHYRLGCHEQDENEYVSPDRHARNGDPCEGAEDEDDPMAVGAKGEGKEGMVLRDCMGINVEAIDLDIDTYLGTRTTAKGGDEKESKLSIKRMNWGFLSRGKKAEREGNKEEDESNVTPTSDLEQKEEKSVPGFGLRRLMGFGMRKAPPPPLSIPNKSPGAIEPRSTRDTILVEGVSEQKGKTHSSSPPVSPRKTISGPYVLGSHLPLRSPPAYSSIPSPSSFLHDSRSIPSSSSNTSLNKTNHYNYHDQISPSSGNIPYRSRSRSIRSVHRTNPSLTTITNLGLGMCTERTVGLNISGTRPKGFMASADVQSLSAVPVPLKAAPSYESFRSSKSIGGRSEVGSIKSAKSVSGGSMRSFRTWMGKVGTGVGSCNNTGVTLAVAE